MNGSLGRTMLGMLGVIIINLFTKTTDITEHCKYFN
jgi:hypothetical protein